MHPIPFKHFLQGPCPKTYMNRIKWLLCLVQAPDFYVPVPPAPPGLEWWEYKGDVPPLPQPQEYFHSKKYKNWGARQYPALTSHVELPSNSCLSTLPSPAFWEQASDPRVHMQAGDMTRTIRWWSTRFRIWTSPQWPTSAVGTPGQRCGITVSGCPLPSGEAAIMHKIIN